MDSVEGVLGNEIESPARSNALGEQEKLAFVRNACPVDVDARAVEEVLHVVDAVLVAVLPEELLLAEVRVHGAGPAAADAQGGLDEAVGVVARPAGDPEVVVVGPRVVDAEVR